MCPYGHCRMVNLCKSGWCVREGMERDGYILQDDGTMKKVEKKPSETLTESGTNPTKAPS